MSGLEVTVIFLIMWWLVLFTTLPFGVSRQEDPEPGTEVGAPENPRLWMKALATTAITTVLTGAIYIAAENGWLPIREWLAPETPRAAGETD